MPRTSATRCGCAAAADKVGLTPLLGRCPKSLSGGQRQRVALARAIVRQPNLLLMDEPLSNLDAILRVSMRAELKHLHHELGATVVYVTHDQIEAMTLATRVAVMNRGAVEQLGSPQQIYEEPDNLFVTRFIGTPPMNLVRGWIDAGGFANEAMRLPGVGHAGAGEVVLGSRPDRVAIDGSDRADLRGPVFSSEYTGAGVQVTVKVGGTHVTALAGVGTRPGIGGVVGLRFARAAIYLFDAATGRRVAAGHREGQRP